MTRPDIETIRQIYAGDCNGEGGLPSAVQVCDYALKLEAVAIAAREVMRPPWRRIDWYDDDCAALRKALAEVGR